MQVTCDVSSYLPFEHCFSILHARGSVARHCWKPLASLTMNLVKQITFLALVVAAVLVTLVATGVGARGCHNPMFLDPRDCGSEARSLEGRLEGELSELRKPLTHCRKLQKLNRRVEPCDFTNELERMSQKTHPFEVADYRRRLRRMKICRNEPKCNDLKKMLHKLEITNTRPYYVADPKDPSFTDYLCREYKATMEDEDDR